MVRRRRHPQRNGVPLPRSRSRDQGRRNHGQYSGYGRLHDSGGVHALLADAARAGAEFRQSGIHQDGVLKNAQTYEIMRPESVGVKQSSLVLGKHSGRHAFIHKLEEMGYKLGDNQLEDAFARMKALADRKKDIYDEDIEALVDQEIAASHDRIKLASLTVIAGTHGPQRATMKLNIDGQVKIEEPEGNGPVDAVFNCIKALVPHEAKLELFQVHAVTEGTDAQAEVSVRLAHEGRSMTSKASDPDTLVASAKAYLGALHKIVMKRQRDVPAAAAS